MSAHSLGRMSSALVEEAEKVELKGGHGTLGEKKKGELMRRTIWSESGSAITIYTDFATKS